MNAVNEKFLRPPIVQNESGKIRKVGFEIEFAAKDCYKIAQKIVTLFGGHLKKINPHYFEVLNSSLGTFSVQLDTQFVHPESKGDLDDKILEYFSKSEAKEKFYELLGDIGKVVVPYEVISSPVPIDSLEELNSLIAGLKELGVEGTDEGFFYAFGVHINPEASSLKAKSILNHLRAFLLLSDWFHEIMNIDLMRRLLPYINKFPRSYAIKVLSPEYAPEIDQLIDDYILDNPTRNRELDLLPLFTHLAKNRVQSQMKDTLTSARPTYHYRLPDCRLNDSDWSLASEWNLWVKVEELANSPDKIKNMSAAYIKHFQSKLTENWTAEVKKWIQK